jgi:pimeloyl-ACP methyl ester carboxylesterase
VTDERIGDLLLRHEPPVAGRRAGPLLLVHGLWGGAWVWDRWLPYASSRGWDTWAIEHRGRNGSRSVDDLGRVRIADLVGDVREVVGRLGPCAVVGFSMGGLVVQALSAEEPDLRAVVYLCSVAPGGVFAINRWMVRGLARYLPTIVRGGAFRPKRADADVLLFNGTPRHLADATYPRLIPDSGTIAREIMVGSVRVDASRIRCPRLVVSTREDHVSPRALQPRLVKKYGAEHVAVAGLDHMHLCHPEWERVAKVTLDWLERVTN